jgi:hypothetical protein
MGGLKAMSISTVALIPRVVRFAMVLALQSMCLWLPAVGSLAGETPTPAYRFESFAAAQMNPDRAASAIELWKFVAAALHRDYGDAPVERMRDYFMFTAIGSDTFLVMGPGFYVAKPRAGLFELITPAWHLDAIDLPVFHSLAQGGAWALVRVDAVRHGQHETDVGALFVGGGPTGPDPPEVIYANIGTFESASLAQPQAARIVARSP